MDMDYSVAYFHDVGMCVVAFMAVDPVRFSSIVGNSINTTYNVVLLNSRSILAYYSIRKMVPSYNERG